jgi:hypothetical protein
LYVSEKGLICLSLMIENIKTRLWYSLNHLARDGCKI